MSLMDLFLGIHELLFERSSAVATKIAVWPSWPSACADPS